MSASHLETLLGLNYGYVALTTLWVYDYILCMPDSVAYLAESQWGLGTLPYLACSHLPFAFMLMNMLGLVQPNAPSTLCHFYFAASSYIGIATMFFAESIFLVRAYIVWKKRILVIIIITSIIAYLVPIIICFHEMISLASGKCWIPGGIGYLDTMTSSKLIVVYCLLVLGELEILLLLLYPAHKEYGWRINNRLMRGLIQHNLLYFCISFAFSLTIILALIFLPYPLTHMIEDFQVVLQSVLVNRMHRDFWKSDRASCDIYGQSISLTTFMTVVPDLV